MTQKEMTRAQAEEMILRNLREIRDVYLAYNPDGDWLRVCVSKGYISAENAFSYGEPDHDKPISVHA